jgi:diguanylate cyclase (GGDEF)-like protein
MNDLKLRIHAKCVRIAYRQRLRSLLSVLIVSIIPLIIGWPEETRYTTLALVMALFAYSFISIYLVHRFNHSQVEDHAALAWGRLFYFQLCLLALLFNAVFLNLHYHGVEGALLMLIIVSTGFGAGTISAYHYLKWSGVWFIAPVILPQLIHYGSQQTTSALFTAILLFIFMAFMIMVSLEQHRESITALMLREELEQAKHEAESLARTDPLTELNNRRAFFELAPSQLNNAHRLGYPLSLVMLDIDHFKRINDSYGHAVGDTVLVSVGGLLRQFTRESDLVGRLGGEEFAILLSASDRIAAEEYAERLRERLAQIDFAATGHEFSITASLGISQYQPRHDSIDSLLERADSALYDAKNQGRNRSVVARHDHPDATFVEAPDSVN